MFGLRHRNETVSGALTKVSMAGGLEFFIDGEGFDDQPHISSVMFVPTQGEATELIGPPLNSKCICDARWSFHSKVCPDLARLISE